VRLEALRGSERRVERIVGMIGLTLDETPIFNVRNGAHKPCSNGPTVSYSFKHGSFVAKPVIGSRRTWSLD